MASTLTSYRAIRGTIRCETGLRIGGSNEHVEIGELENTIVRHPISDEPYIPGSTLKGKLRSLLEYRYDRRDMRNDRRDMHEDWRSYREAHRDTFRRGAYAGPRGFVYRAPVIGFRFDPIFFSSRYWIANPWMYRLPPASPGLRWIRYGNDAVLVNMRTGRVVQVFRDFFW